MMRHRMLRGFSIFSSFLKINKEASKIKYDLKVPQRDQTFVDSKISIKNLNRGCKLIIESPKYPCNASIFVMYSSGSKNEEKDEKGVLQSLKNTYFGIKEPDLLGNLQLMGSSIAMDFDQESTFFSGTFLPEFTEDYLKTLYSIINNEKTSNEQAIISERFSQFWQSQNAQSLDSVYKEVLLQSIFTEPLSSPLSGAREFLPTIEKINSFSETHLKNYPSIIIISGIQNPEPFSNIFQSIFTSLLTKPPTSQPESNFIYQDNSFFCDNDLSFYTISFKGAKLSDPNHQKLELLQYLYGDSSNENFFSRAMESKNQSNIAKTLRAFNISYKETGAFSFNIISPSKFASKALKLLVEEILNLENVNEEEFENAKSRMILDVVRNYQDREKRIENWAKEMDCTGKINTLSEVIEGIKNIGLKEIKDELRGLRKSEGNLLYFGKEIEGLPKYEDIKDMITKEIR
ncbi:hypothetical protein SteCoe_40 [Stentor coeruleus]|uniref:Peptidase M16 C-terminal domain-containing protein n=1 Tax=Stentor coeruleus TaxID=5963 RepID=A0A1R2D516_9CILI|nr:hypothetical protein SteCoe_40 [Stentor coeruleus]